MPDLAQLVILSLVLVHAVLDEVGLGEVLLEGEGTM
jgi:hypothetical protein